MNEIIIQAIGNRKYIEFLYHGHRRIVEPHTYGISAKEKHLLRGYQTAGGSRRGGIPDWRLYDLSNILELRFLDEVFLKPRPGYKLGDSAMRIIFAELKESGEAELAKKIFGYN